MRLHQNFLLVFIFFLSLLSCSTAATIQFPDWYQMQISLSESPRINRELTAEVTIKPLLADLENLKVRLFIPENWKVDAAEKNLSLAKANQNNQITFRITPSSYLSQGSIIVEAVMKTPFKAIENEILRLNPEPAAEMIKALQEWPAESKRYSEISFALLQDESFYPLSLGMWLNYAEEMAPNKEFRGPVFFDDTMITTYQAQTDVEMFEKLINYGKSDPELEKKLLESGVDLKKKKFDQLNGLYLLAARLFIEKNHQDALNFLHRLEAELGQNSAEFENLEIATMNLKGLVFWAQNQKRLAEDFLKKAFYRNRKNPLQRYVLRNIALLMISNREKATAEQMMRLALEFNTGYTLLEQEYERVKKL